MKKFLVLFMAALLLAFAGSAYAVTAGSLMLDTLAGQPASGTINASGAKGELSYSKADGPSWVSVSGSTVTITPSIAVRPGSYTATVTVTDTFQSYVGHVQETQTETATATVSITIQAPALLLSLSTSATTVRVGDPVTIWLTSTGGYGTATFASITAGVTVSGGTATFTPTAAGSFPLEFTVTDAVGATSTKRVTITVNPLPDPLAMTVTASPTTVFVGEPVTITLASTGGDGAVTFSSTTAGVSLSGNTATFTPTAAGSFTLDFTATDAAGNTVNGSASVTANEVPAPVSPDEIPEEEREADDVVEDVEEDEVEEEVTIEVVTLSSDMTTEVTEEVITQTLTKDASAAIASDDNYSDEEKELASNTTENTNTTVGNLAGDGTLPNAPTVPSNNLTIKPMEGNVNEKAAQCNAENGNSSSGALMGFNVNSSQAGNITVSMPRQPVNAWGLLARGVKKILNALFDVKTADYNAFSVFVAAAEEANTDTVIFLDSNGKQTTTIPTETDEEGNKRIGGFMTMVTYVEADTDYDFVISVPTEELEAKGIEKTVTTASVPVPTFTASKMSYFTTFVSADLVNNSPYYRVGENVISSKLNSVTVGSDWARTDEEKALANQYSYTMISRLAAFDASSEANTNTYVVAVNFSSDKIAKIDTTEKGGFIFYPNGPAEAAAVANVWKSVTSEDGKLYFEALTPEEIKNGATSGYLTFEIEGGTTLSKPMLAVKVVAGEPVEFSFTISKPSINVVLDATETAELTAEGATGTVTYTADVDWVTVKDGVATFTPVAVGEYTVKITGTDEAGKEYSIDVPVTVTDGSGPTENLGLRASSSTLNLRVGQTETVTLTASNLQGAATYSVEAEEAAGVTLAESTTATTTATVKPTAAGVYTLTFRVTDSGRTENSTVSTVVLLTVTAGGGVGSSGGGCSAGWSVLALALLGGLIARKK